MSDFEVRTAVADRLKRAMHEKEQRLRMRRYGLAIGVMLITTTIVFTLYVFMFSSELGIESKNLLTTAISPFVAVWSAALGFYFSRSSKDSADNASSDSDLTLYKELISVGEESSRLRYLLKRQSIEYEDKIFELNKRIADLEKSQGSMN